MWAEQLDPEGLSQGDLVADLVFANVHPLAPVVKASLHGKPGWLAQAWSEDSSGICRVVATARMAPGVILSHSCDIDKKSSKARIFTAPVIPLKNLAAAEQQNVIEQRRITLFPLIGTAAGDFYADLRLATALDQRLFEGRRRIASMTEEGRLMLQARLTLIFSRRQG